MANNALLGWTPAERLDYVVGFLDDARPDGHDKNGPKFRASCANADHPDADPSMDVAIGNDGGIVCFCRSRECDFKYVQAGLLSRGCETAALRKSNGWVPAHLRPPPPPHLVPPSHPVPQVRHADPVADLDAEPLPVFPSVDHVEQDIRETYSSHDVKREDRSDAEGLLDSVFHLVEHRTQTKLTLWAHRRAEADGWTYWEPKRVPSTPHRSIEAAAAACWWSITEAKPDLRKISPLMTIDPRFVDLKTQEVGIEARWDYRLPKQKPKHQMRVLHTPNGKAPFYAFGPRNPSLWNLAEFNAAEPFNFFEGAKDARNARECGISNVLTCLNGANGFDVVDIAPLAASPGGTVWADNDDAGKDAAQRLSNRLHEQNSKIIVKMHIAASKKKGDFTDLRDKLRDDGMSDDSIGEHALAKARLEAKILEPEVIVEIDTRPHAEPVMARTDLGNGDAFADAHGDGLRYLAHRGSWLVWDSCRWGSDKTSVAVDRAAHNFLVSEYVRATNEHRESDRTWFFACGQGQHLEKMVKRARTRECVRVEQAQLDSDPWLLNVANGTLELKGDAVKFREHRKSDLITKLAPVIYDPNAVCSLWERTVSDWMYGRPALVQFLQRSLGYSISGCVKHHLAFFNIGTGRNGKGVCMNLCANLLGDYSEIVPISALLKKKPGSTLSDDIAKLAGARLAMITEFDKDDKLAEAMLKRLSGGDPLSARGLYQDLFDFNPSHHIWLSANYRPVIEGTDIGIWSRVKLIPWDNCFDGREDVDLSDKLAVEASGVLNWLIKGCLDFQRYGLDPPEPVRKAVAEYRAESDIFSIFKREWLIADATAVSPSRTLYVGYRSWAQGAGEKEMSENMFGRCLTRHKFHKGRATDGRRGWFGVRLREPGDAPKALEPETPPPPPV